MPTTKIIHTSDWHLGKKLYHEGRGEEHEAFLNWLLDFAEKEEANILLFSGDLFDSPTPGHAALKSYYDFLARWFGASPEREAFILGGNHDSGHLIDAPKSLHSQAKLEGRLHLLGNFDPNNWNKLIVKRPWGSVCALPYFRLHEILNLAKSFFPDRVRSSDEEGQLILDSISELMNRFRAETPQDLPRFLMGHHLFGPYSASGSELGLPLSGLETINLASLGKWDYVALGHIHKPQKLSFKEMPVIYSGSPLRMRFSEHENKRISLIELNGDTLDYRWCDIPVFRKLYRFRADIHNFKEKLSELKLNEQSNPTLLPSFIEAELECEAPWVGAADEIRDFLEQNFKEERRPKLLAVNHQIKNGKATDKMTEAPTPRAVHDFSNINLSDFFASYYLTKFPESTEVPAEIMNLFKDLQSSALSTEDANED